MGRGKRATGQSQTMGLVVINVTIQLWMELLCASEGSWTLIHLWCSHQQPSRFDTYRKDMDTGKLDVLHRRHLLVSQVCRAATEKHFSDFHSVALIERNCFISQVECSTIIIYIHAIGLLNRICRHMALIPYTSLPSSVGQHHSVKLQWKHTFFDLQVLPYDLSTCSIRLVSHWHTRVCGFECKNHSEWQSCMTSLSKNSQNYTHRDANTACLSANNLIPCNR